MEKQIIDLNPKPKKHIDRSEANAIEQMRELKTVGEFSAWLDTVDQMGWNEYLEYAISYLASLVEIAESQGKSESEQTRHYEQLLMKATALYRQANPRMTVHRLD